MRGSDPQSRWEEVERWLAVAKDDQTAVEVCLAAEPPLREIAAFHCQQAVEKLLKGFLICAEKRFRKTHSLAELGAAVIESFPELESFVKATEDWTLWVAGYRYPSAEGAPEPEPGDEELKHALSVIDALAAQLRSKQPS